MEKTLTVNESFLKLAYNAACDEWKQKIEKEFPKVFNQKITNKVKNWQSILDLSGKDEKDVVPFRNPRTKQEKSINAFAKIQLITEVLNEGHEFDFNNSSEYKYYPYFEKKSSGWVVRSFLDYSLSHLGSGCYLWTSELALFAGNTFLDIYNDYLPK